MSRLKPGRTLDSMRKTILNTSARSFLKNGFTATKLRSIADETGYNIGSVINLFPHKEDILCALVDFAIDEQFRTAMRLAADLKDITPVNIYSLDTALELYMAENSESVCDLYLSAYSLTKPSDEIYARMAEHFVQLFGDRFPGYQERDFYLLDVACASVMRGYLTIPCDENFTIEQKVALFLQSSLRILKVSEEEIDQQLEFLKQFDFNQLAIQSIHGMLNSLEDPDFPV